MSICLWAFSQGSVETLHLPGPQIKLVISTNSKVLLSFCVPTLLSICAAYQTNLKILLHHCVISHLINLQIFCRFSLQQLIYSVVSVSGIQQNESVIHISSCFQIFSHIGHYRVLSKVPCAILRYLLVIYFVYSGMYTSFSCSFHRITDHQHFSPR